MRNLVTQSNGENIMTILFWVLVIVTPLIGFWFACLGRFKLSTSALAMFAALTIGSAIITQGVRCSDLIDKYKGKDCKRVGSGLYAIKQGNNWLVVSSDD